MSESRGYATRTLTHYISELWTSAGFRWNGDHVSEMESIVDAIVTVAVLDANAHADRRVLELAERCARLADESAQALAAQLELTRIKRTGRDGGRRDASRRCVRPGSHGRCDG